MDAGAYDAGLARGWLLFRMSLGGLESDTAADGVNDDFEFFATACPERLSVRAEHVKL